MRFRKRLELTPELELALTVGPGPLSADLTGADLADAWRGPNDQGQPHPLTTGELSRLLRRFGIRARNWWPTPRLPGPKSFLGYCRADFEQAWADHCPETSTAPHPSKIITLARH